mmetsp:Transcript_9417/g.22995  ORF Transcript_9417/g.22995 Transcript_9417/m.22995 type:complete len:119 (+) Transcript_9417:91-447(+)
MVQFTSNAKAQSNYHIKITMIQLGTRSRRNAIGLDAAVISQKEAVILDVVGLAPRRVVSIHEAKQIHGIEYPNTPLSSTRSTIIPDALQLLAFCTPMFAHASHHTNVWGLVCLCPNAP